MYSMSFELTPQAANSSRHAAKELRAVLEIGRLALELVFDHATPPGIRRRIAHGTGNTFERGELVTDLAQGKVEGIT
jgi:hypothetical protein